MIRKLARHFDPAYVVPELRAERGAVTVPNPSPEQKAAEDAQVRLLEAALGASATRQLRVQVSAEQSRSHTPRQEVLVQFAGGLPSAPFKLADLAAAANDAELADFKAKIASGELTPEAPCNGMYDQWTPDQEAKLNAALQKALGIR